MNTDKSCFVFLSVFICVHPWFLICSLNQFNIISERITKMEAVVVWNFWLLGDFPAAGFHFLPPVFYIAHFKGEMRAGFFAIDAVFGADVKFERAGVHPNSGRVEIRSLDFAEAEKSDVKL